MHQRLHNLAGRLARTAKPWRRLWADQVGANTMEWTLLLAFIAVPSYFITKLALDLLTGHYWVMTTLNGLPFP